MKMIGWFQRLFIFIFTVTIITNNSSADESPKYAERGITAYHSGRYDLAQLFFAKALQDAILKGKEEWIAKATLNLFDVELETMEYTEAGRLLDGFNTRDKNLMALIDWKKSQLAFQQRHISEAITFIDRAIQASKGDEKKSSFMQLDRLRYLIQSTDPANWENEYSAFIKSSSGKSLDRGRLASLNASVAMAHKNFSSADSLWNLAEDFYREQGQLAKVAACLNQAAICQYSSGRHSEARETNSRAIAIYSELGLEMPGLRAQALRLLLVENPVELAKLKQEMDLLGQKFSGFDLQGLLDEYSHSMQLGSMVPSH